MISAHIFCEELSCQVHKHILPTILFIINAEVETKFFKRTVIFKGPCITEIVSYF